MLRGWKLNLTLPSNCSFQIKLNIIANAKICTLFQVAEQNCCFAAAVMRICVPLKQMGEVKGAYVLFGGSSSVPVQYLACYEGELSLTR